MECDVTMRQKGSAMYEVIDLRKYFDIPLMYGYGVCYKWQRDGDGVRLLYCFDELLFS